MYQAQSVMLTLMNSHGSKASLTETDLRRVPELDGMQSADKPRFSLLRGGCHRATETRKMDKHRQRHDTGRGRPFGC